MNRIKNFSLFAILFSLIILIPLGFIFLYFKDFGNGFVRFDGDLLKAVYIVGKINKIIEKTNFKYKNLYKGTEQSVTLKFEYINNNFMSPELLNNI